jgi:NADPH:quinone reductase-like Zn-dependent oxidoreductase
VRTTKTVSADLTCTVSYCTNLRLSKKEDWPAKIGALVQSHNPKKGTMLDAVIDSGGGDILGQISNYLKQGGKVVCYGMCAQHQFNPLHTQNVTPPRLFLGPQAQRSHSQCAKC